MLHKRKQFLSGSLLVALGLLTYLPLRASFLGFLQIPNHVNLSWDPACHFTDGMKLYLQLRDLDLASFIFQILSFGFWLPFHPLLVAITHLFFPLQIEPAVFLNYILLCGALAWASFRGLATFLGIAACLHLLAGSIIFVSLLNNVMLEMTAFSLSLIFFTCALTYLESRSHKMFEVATWSLLALFLTKIHYGILVGPIWILQVITLTQPHLPTRALLNQFVRKTLNRTYVRVFLSLWSLALLLLILRLLSGVEVFQLFSLKISVSRLGNFIWFLLWLPLCVWTIEWASGRNTLLGALPWELKILHKICFFPFAWLYLFPLRHKVGAFLYNAQFSTSVAPSGFLGRTQYYPQILWKDYLGLSPAGGWILAALFGMTGILLAFRLSHRGRNHLKWETSGAFLLWTSFAWFFLVMSYLNSNQEPRMAITWVAIFVVGVGYFMHLLVGTSKKLQLVCGVAGMLCLFAPHSLGTPNEVAQEIRGIYLPLDYKGMDFVLEHFDPKRPGVIYGLGMDQGNPLITLRLLPRIPRGSSFWAKKNVYLNDFGLAGNQDPLGFVLAQAAQGTRQFVLYRAGFDPQAFKQLVQKLLSLQGLALLRETQDYVFIADQG